MNWFRKPKLENQSIPELTTSILYDESTFYKKFVKDLSEAKEEVIIESPFITHKRLEMLKPTFEKIVATGTKLFIITKDPQEHDEAMANFAEEGIRYFEHLGAHVLLIKGGHHRKLAIIDRKVYWIGSLNILSQYMSRELMQRTENRQFTEELFHFLRFNTLSEFPKKLNLL